MLIIVACLVIQDVIMSQLRLFGATTDLAVGAILLITVIEGTDVGSVFVLFASALYWFSGSAPTPVCIALLTFFGLGTTMFRQPGHPDAVRLPCPDAVRAGPVRHGSVSGPDLLGKAPFLPADKHLYQSHYDPAVFSGLQDRPDWR